MSPRMRPTSVPSGILIHTAVWPQYTWAENWEALPPILGRGAGSPSSTMWPGPRPTSMPSAILIQPDVWPQQTCSKNWGFCPLLGEGAGSPSNTKSPGLGRGLPPYQMASQSIQPFGHNRYGPKIGGCALWGGGAGSLYNKLWPGPRLACMPSFILIHPTVWPQYTNVSDRTDRQDR